MGASVIGTGTRKTERQQRAVLDALAWVATDLSAGAGAMTPAQKKVREAVDLEPGRPGARESVNETVTVTAIGLGVTKSRRTRNGWMPQWSQKRSSPSNSHKPIRKRNFSDGKS